jgi:hypothetical protein
MEEPQQGRGEEQQQEQDDGAAAGPPRPPSGAEEEEEEDIDVGPQPPKPKKRKVRAAEASLPCLMVSSSCLGYQAAGVTAAKSTSSVPQQAQPDAFNPGYQHVSQAGAVFTAAE